MDFINKFANQASSQQENQPQGEPQQQQSQSSGGGIFDKLNGLAGGGAQGEKKEDSLDKGMLTRYLDYVMHRSPKLTNNPRHRLGAGECPQAGQAGQ